MKKWQKRLIISLSIIAVAVGTAFIVFHDDSDLEAIEKEQQESIDEVTSQDNFDAIGDDLENFESNQDTL